MKKEFHLQMIGYKGTEEPGDWITDSVTEYYPSFFAYWKKVEKQLTRSVMSHFTKTHHLNK